MKQLFFAIAIMLLITAEAWLLSRNERRKKQRL